MRCAVPLVLLASALASTASEAYAQEPYRRPPEAMAAIVEAPPSPSVQFSPDGRFLLFVEQPSLPPIADVSRRMLRLAGMRIDPAAHGPFRTSYATGLRFRRLTEENELRVPLPAGARLDRVSWSHDSKHFALVVVGEQGSELWVASVEEPGKPRRLSDRLNTVLGGPSWLPAGDALLFREAPTSFVMETEDERGIEPFAPTVPKGPNVQETSGEKSPLRTYQDLLSNPYDELLFDFYALAQLVVASVDGSSRQKISHPDLYLDARFAPDGEHLLVTRIGRPFSYLMPYYHFPQKIDVWNRKGEHVASVADVPLAENVPIGGVRTGRRSVGWMPGHPATLTWVEALDGGDPKQEVEHRDRWSAWDAPFDGEPRALLEVEHRAWDLTYLADPRWVIAGEYDRDRRWVRRSLVDLEDGSTAARVLEDRSIRDRYGDPGSILTHPDEQGFRVVRQDGDWIYRSGSGASPEGLLPFLDRWNLRDDSVERLWRCEPGSYESVATLLEGGAFVTRHETPTDPPNYRLRRPNAEPVALTAFPDPTPQIRGIHKELVTYERADGVPLSATLYLPADYQEGTRLPLLVWAYPIEFNDPSTAGQVTRSPSRFTRITGYSHLTLLTQGYAIMDGATMPIIGDAETMNDTFVEQIVSAAQAAIDYAAERGVADPERVGVGGHSYGAFMTANLLAHSDLFKAGVARSGAYNRTLTPFGFQSERRTFWEAPEAYFAVSPFMHAHKIAEPLLLIHGEIDNNSGTYPLQSERMFQAIKGNGGEARLVMLPHESHGYRARESVLHVLYEMASWFDRHLEGDEAMDAGFERED